jgi:septal ring factor EnvC (AmiA/AmiB activator)
VIDGEQAWVDTSVLVGGRDPFRMAIKTVLLQENKHWKVDYRATVASISSNSDVARLLGSLNDLGMQFADKLEQSISEMQRALPEAQKEIEKIEENMNQKLPELRRRMEELMQQLEEILRDRKQPQTAQGTKQI